MNPRIANPRARRARGFTLIELVAVIVILGSVATVATSAFLDLRRDARVAALQTIASTAVTNMNSAIGAWQVRGGGASVTVGGISVPVNQTDTDFGGTVIPGSPTGAGMYLMLKCGTSLEYGGTFPCAGMPGFMIAIWNDASVTVWPAAISDTYMGGGIGCNITSWSGFGVDSDYPVTNLGSEGTRAGWSWNFYYC